LGVVQHGRVQDDALVELGVLALLQDAGHHVLQGHGIGAGRVEQLLKQLHGRLQVGIEAAEADQYPVLAAAHRKRAPELVKLLLQLRRRVVAGA
nr:hypothetical protein [Tanacetum cinerariifolium]